jgi:hypothetical protein
MTVPDPVPTWTFLWPLKKNVAVKVVYFIIKI